VLLFSACRRYEIDDLRKKAPNAQIFSLDKSGRYLLSHEHAKLLGFPNSKDIVITGNHDHFSIYAKHVWNETFDNH